MYQRILFVFLCCAMGLAVAQEVHGDSLVRMLEAAKIYYNSGEYENAISELENALQYLKQLEQGDQVEAYKYLAFSYVAFGNNAKAKEQFKKALILNPDLELDPAVVSPKIIKVFEEAKSEMARETPPVIEPEPEPEPKPEPQLKQPSMFGALWRSCLLPGWGQKYKGESKKGSQLMIAAGVTFGLSAVSITLMELSHSSYLDVPPNNVDEMNDKYKMYRFWSNAALFSTVSFGVVYLYNIYDAAFKRVRVKYSLYDTRTGPDISVGAEEIRVGYKIAF
jgi:tetratricopeptide (TPR) repeat protein